MPLIDKQAAIDALDVLCQEHRYRIPGKRETYSEYNEAWQDALDRAEGAIGNLPSAQPDEKLERCRFEYIHACKIVSIPTPDVTERDKQDAYAVIKALQPIFGDVSF